jgi:hypothetical protein
MEVTGRLYAPAALLSGKEPPTCVWQEAGCTLELVRTWLRREKYPCPCRKSNPGSPARSLVTMLSYPEKEENKSDKRVKFSSYVSAHCSRKPELLYRYCVILLTQQVFRLNVISVATLDTYNNKLIASSLRYTWNIFYYDIYYWKQNAVTTHPKLVTAATSYFGIMKSHQASPWLSSTVHVPRSICGKILEYSRKKLRPLVRNPAASARPNAWLILGH